MKYLIVGLGNIGPDYSQTRHNIGFMVVDALAAKHKAVFTPARYGDRAEFRFKGRIFVLLKPSSFMNLSGKPVNYWLEKEKIAMEHMLVVVDDLALPLGTLRLRANGGAGGHNGLSSIIDTIGTNSFARLRFGIDSNFPKGFQSQYVLGKWEEEELEVVTPKVDVSCEIALSFGLQGIERTMNLYNKRK